MNAASYQGKRMRPGSHAHRVLRLVGRHPGVSAYAIAEMLRIDMRRACNAASRLVASGLLCWTGNPKRRQYHPIELAPAGARTDLNQRRAPRPGLTADPAVRIAAQRLERPTGDAIVRAGVKVTICPSGSDSRFRFAAPPGWQGEITRDWLARRGLAAGAAGAAPAAGTALDDGA
jgi:hypothetical protein